MNNSLKTYLRYGGSSVITVFTVFAFISSIPPEKAQEFVAALHGFNDSILTAYGYLTKMALILGPASLGLLAKFGVDSGTVVNVIKRVLQIAQSGDTPVAADAQKKLIDATTAVLNSPTPATNTVPVKSAILASAISIPEVATKKIEVTSKALAAATPNDNVVATANAA